ncbi:DUF4405 domain-containing protein [Candidatus Formimonas warabiya]|uniref:Uncharacterized protein n=1 Tax=Formimonas warabiya TaxID=1761012 RepID=A0A3G1KQM8_FORW1|nr:DUF4405 domain-containing protein [Candidatus Formimonas warabiya]ATW24761.1 hypothetical protein DCMF_08225 [Candidatus Formimonas warabiya]
MIGKAGKVRPVISSLLIGIFLICVVTGIIMDSGPHQQPNGGPPISNHSLSDAVGTDAAKDPQGFGEQGGQTFNMKEIHKICGYILVFMIMIHFALNFKMYVTEIKKQ